jgi:hypothetical protein
VAGVGDLRCQTDRGGFAALATIGGHRCDHAGCVWAIRRGGALHESVVAALVAAGLESGVYQYPGGMCDRSRATAAAASGYMTAHDFAKSKSTRLWGSNNRG